MLSWRYGLTVAHCTDSTLNLDVTALATDLRRGHRIDILFDLLNTSTSQNEDKVRSLGRQGTAMQ